MANQPLKNSRTCPVCFSANFSKLRFCLNSKNPFWRKCKNCKSIYANEIPATSVIDEHYTGYYDGINLDIPDFVRSTLEKRINSLSKYRSELNNVLDIGFGAGVFLQAAESKGWSCFGTEYSPDSIRIGNANGWTVHKGDLNERDLIGPFDIVAAIEVLEHVSNPKVIISVSAERLREGGALYGTTPNSQSLNVKFLGERWSVLSYPEHQVLLNKRSMKMLLNNFNLKPVDICSTGFNPIDIINLLRLQINKKKGFDKNDIDRVSGGYAINSVFESRKSLSLLKKLINRILTICGIGDSLVFLAEKAK
jgi:2-polyprenyl-3-methyl-5-hydroxy-6-metoxy-1,4-benzoquinol methylase